MLEPLSKENILKYISQEEILERYLGFGVDYRKKFCNPFRKDNHPDCMFRKGYARIFFADFAQPDYGGDCFKICGLYYGLSIPGDFYEVCRHINNDFMLGLNDGQQHDYKVIERKEIIRSYEKQEKQSVDIKVAVRDFSDYDLSYWYGKYGITLDILKMFNVYRADTVWIDNSVYYHYQEKDLCFAFYFPEDKSFKIYKPFDTYYKWRTNSLQVFGLGQLPETGDLLFITKSLKDIMVLKTLNYLAIAPQAEGHDLSEDLIIDLKKRFKRIIVFYDNDEPGVKSSIRITNKHQLEYFNIPKHFAEKDPSDFVECYNKEELDNLIKQKIDG